MLGTMAKASQFTARATAANFIGTTQTLGNLYIGYAATASGAYNLAGGTLSTLDSSTFSNGQDAEFIGYVGTGSFNQTGGVNLTDNEIVGGIETNGPGVYSQTAGSNTTTNLTIGFTGNGAYTLGGGTLSVGHETIGDFGTFTQTGGVHSASAISLGSGMAGRYDLQGGTLSVAPMHVATGAVFNQTGGAFTGVLDVEGGSFTLSGTGTFSPTFANQLNVSAGTFSQFGGSLGPATIVTQNGGTIAASFVNTGTFIYDGGTFSGGLTNQGAVTFNADFSATLGIINDATLIIPAGRTVVSTSPSNQGTLNQGVLNLAGGTFGSTTITNNGLVSGYGALNGMVQNHASFTQVGGNLAINSFQGSSSFFNTGTMSFAAGYVTQLTTAIFNNGVLYLNGSTITGGTVDNGGAGLGGSLIGPGTITGSFNNDGYFDVTGGAVNIVQAFVNTGAIHLDGGASSLLGGRDHQHWGD